MGSRFSFCLFLAALFHFSVSCLGEEKQSATTQPSADQALWIAARTGNAAEIATLLKNGSDPNAIGAKDSRRAVEVAANFGHADVVKALLRAGATADLPLYREAVAGNHTETILSVIESGVSADTPLDGSGARAIHFAALTNNVELTKALIKKGARIEPVTRDGDTPLHAAAMGNEQVVRLLLENGANRDLKNEKGQTPLDVATEFREWDIAQVLRDRKQPATQPAPTTQPGQK